MKLASCGNRNPLPCLHAFNHRSGVLHYVDPAGKNRTYETVERTTRNEQAGVDGVDIISRSKWQSKHNAMLVHGVKKLSAKYC